MATQTDQNISTYSPAKSRGHPCRSERSNKAPKDQDSKYQSLDNPVNFPRESSSSVDEITKNKSGPERHSPTNNLNIDTSNAVKENLDNEKMKNVTEEQEKNDEKMNKTMYKNKNLQNPLEETHMAKEEYEKKLNVKDGQINKRQNQVKEAKGEYEKKLNVKDSQISELQNRVKEAKGEYEKKLNVKDSQISALQNQLKEAKGEYEKKLNVKDGQINKLQNQAKEAKGEYEKKLNVKDGEITKCQNQVKEAKGEYEKKLNVKDSQISELQNQVKEAKGEYEKKLNVKDSQISELQNQVKEAKGEYEKKLNVKDGQINKLQNQVKEAKGEYEKKQNVKDSHISELQNQLKEAKGEHEKKLNAKDSQINELQNRMEEAKGEYEKKLNVKAGQINKLQNQVKEAKGEYEKKLNAKDGQINELQNRMEEAKGEHEKKVEEPRKKNHVFIGIAVIVGVVAVVTALSLGFKGHEENRHELRLMLVGKTGAGKSATGNTILGENAFRVEASPASVTDNCEKRNKFIAGRNVTIIDTPGVMDTWLTSERTAHHAPQCISIFRPHPHVFLLVIRLGRFTEEEMNAVKWIQENFGEEALRFTLILFTGGDLLEGKPVEKFITNSNELQNLVDTCQGRYHVFNNYEQSNRSQVTQLFEKINQMLHENMGYIYSVELKIDEKRKMNKMAKKLRDEQFENTKLKAELNETHNSFSWYLLRIVIFVLIFTVAWFIVKQSK